MSYRQRAFWLRDNSSFVNDDDDDDYYQEHFKDSNRSIWCEEGKGDCPFPSYEVSRTHSVTAVEVLHLGDGSDVCWYPYEEPFGGMKLLQIKSVL